MRALFGVLLLFGQLHQLALSQLTYTTSVTENIPGDTLVAVKSIDVVGTRMFVGFDDPHNFVQVYELDCTLNSGACTYDWVLVETLDYNTGSLAGTVASNQGFGYAIDGTYNLRTKEVVAMSEPIIDGSAGGGIVHIMKRIAAKWTSVAQVRAGDAIDSGTNIDMFGYDVELDEYDPTTMIVGAPYADYNNGAIHVDVTGKAYMFESSPTATFWTQSQILYGDTTNDYNYFAQVVEVSDRNVAITESGSCSVYFERQQPERPVPPPPCVEDDDEARRRLVTVPSVGQINLFASFSQPELPQWSLQQKFTYDCDSTLEFEGSMTEGVDHTLLDVSMFDNTVVVGVPGAESVNPYVDLGAVYAYHFSSTMYHCDDWDLASMVDSETLANLRKEAHYDEWKNYYDYRRMLHDDDHDHDHDHNHCHEPKPKPPPMCEYAVWTATQVLTPPALDRADCLYYGDNVEVYENTLAVYARVCTYDVIETICNCTLDNSIDSYVYIYTRDSENDLWEYSTRLDGDGDYGSLISIDSNDVTIRWCEDITGGSVPTIDCDSQVTTYVTDSEWNCLIIYMGDQFGDGWGGADLVITSPDGSTERFTADCENYNYYHRWCPDTYNDNGEDRIYTLEIPRGASFPFHWEIYWSIYFQQTGQTIIGGAPTKLKVRWDLITSSVVLVEALDFREEEEYCTVCPGSPTMAPTRPTARPSYPPDPKPKPGPMLRSLKGHDHDHTRSPTISPAPTVIQSAYTDDEEWKTLVLLGDGSGWWQSDLKGINYYISDDTGMHLLRTGTLCSGAVEYDCPQNYELPDDDRKYILRVGGAMATSIDPQDAVHFCKYNNMDPTEHMTFQVNVEKIGTTEDGELIKRSDCEILAHYMRDQYCAKLEKLGVEVLGTMLLSPMYEILTIADRNAFQYAFSGIFHSDEMLDVFINSETLLSNYVRVYFKVLIPFGYLGISTENEIINSEFVNKTYYAAYSKISTSLSNGQLFSDLSFFASSKHTLGYATNLFDVGTLTIKLESMHLGELKHPDYQMYMYEVANSMIYDHTIPPNREPSTTSEPITKSNFMVFLESFESTLVGLVIAALAVYGLVLWKRRSLEQGVEELPIVQTDNKYVALHSDSIHTVDVVASSTSAISSKSKDVSVHNETQNTMYNKSSTINNNNTNMSHNKSMSARSALINSNSTPSRVPNYKLGFSDTKVKSALPTIEQPPSMTSSSSTSQNQKQQQHNRHTTSTKHQEMTSSSSSSEDEYSDSD